MASSISHLCPGGEIGRHAGFRIQCFAACRFKSYPGHSFPSKNLLVQIPSVFIWITRVCGFFCGIGEKVGESE